MKQLHQLAKLIRSKNAGPFTITLDIIFPDRATFDRVLATGALNLEPVAALYDLPPGLLRRYELPLANAIKFSYPRKFPSGDFFDEDLYGCQQHESLVMLNIPL